MGSMGRIAIALATCALVGAIGCSGHSEDDDDDEVGSSGVPRDRYMDELTPAEIQRLCEWGIGAQGGPGQKVCSDGTTVDTPTVSECASNPFDFHCPVRLLEDCMDAVHGDPCRLLDSPACEPYIRCVTQSL